MTIEEAQKIIHRTYEGNTDYLDSTEEDYLLRLGFINDARRAWGDEEGVKWNELFVKLSDASSGDTTTTASQDYILLPDDFDTLESYVKIYSSSDSYTLYPYKKAGLFSTDNPAPFVSITGNAQDTRKLYIRPTPSGVFQVDYWYYKSIQDVSVTTSKIEMSKPMYVVHSVLAMLYEIDGRNSLVTYHEGKANALLTQMIHRNEIPPEFNAFELENIGSDVYGEVFGE